MNVFDKFGSSPFTVNEIRTPDEVEESLVWSRLKESEILQFNSTVSGIKFSPVAPHSIVCLSGLSGPWIDGRTRVHKFSFSKTKAKFSSVAFRKDGVLIALGREDSTVDTYPVSDHQALHRRWKLDSGIIFSIQFSPFDNRLFVACGNGTVKVIGIALRGDIVSIDAHSDACTAIAPLESGNVWVTAGNDAVIKVWDMNSQTCMAEVDAGNPVSQLVVNGSRVFAAAGESVVVVDVQSKTSLIANFAAHTRPIVGMAIVRSNLVTASADRTIKVFDPASFAVLHTIKVHSDITALDVMPDASAMAIGLAGGVLQLKYAVKEEKVKEQREAQMPANFRVFRREPPKKEALWNRALRKFNLSDALDLVLETNDDAEIVGLIDELDRLGRLETAIRGRDAEGLTPLLEFLIKNAANPVWSHVVLKAVVAVEKIYRSVIGDEPRIGELFEKLVSVIDEELETQIRAARLVGQIDILLNTVT